MTCKGVQAVPVCWGASPKPFSLAAAAKASAAASTSKSSLISSLLSSASSSPAGTELCQKEIAKELQHVLFACRRFMCQEQDILDLGNVILA